MAKTKYKIWIQIERITVNEDGSEDYEDEDQHINSAGEYSLLQEAIAVSNEINETYGTNEVHESNA